MATTSTAGAPSAPPPTSASKASTSTSPADRAILLQSAITFLNDAKVQSAPLTRKIAFLESKGLTSQEIQEAIAVASSSASSASSAAANAAPTSPAYGAYPHGQQHYPYAAAPPLSTTSSDWKLWVTMLLATGQIGYTIYQATKSWWPSWLRAEPVPADPSTEADASGAADASSAAAAAVAFEKALQTVQSKQEATYKETHEQLQSILSLLKESLPTASSDAAEHASVERDIEQLKQDLSAQSPALTQIQAELKSLKGLLLSRKQFTTISSSSSPRTGSITSPATAGDAQAPSYAAAAAAAASTASEANDQEIKLPAWQLPTASADADPKAT